MPDSIIYRIYIYIGRHLLTRSFPRPPAQCQVVGDKMNGFSLADVVGSLSRTPGNRGSRSCPDRCWLTARNQLNRDLHGDFMVMNGYCNGLRMVKNG